MNDFIDGIMDRPASHRIGGWIVIIGLIIFIFWNYFYKDQLDELTKLNNDIENLNTQIAHEQRLARNLSKARAEVKDLDIKLKFAMQELPDKREIPELLASISDLAMDAGLEVSLFKPKNENFREFFAEVPVSVGVEGTFHQVTTFFDEVGRLPRIVNINQIEVRDPKIRPEEVRIKTDCLATTFRYLEESERIKKVKKKKRGGRRGRN